MMVRKNLVTEDEFLSANVDSADGHLKFTRDNGVVIDAGKVSGDVTPEALAARDAAQVSAAQAAQSAVQAQGIALGDLIAAQGAVFHVGPTPPPSATQDGYPVLWVDTTEEVAPTPVNPPVPAWDDVLSQFTVPTGVVGIDYVWTSGGGGVGGVLTPGATLSTTGAFPRKVTITPTPKPGYVLTPGVGAFVHDFPDPNAATIRTSDSYATGVDFTGRSTDASLGGIALPYAFPLGGAAAAKIVGGQASHDGSVRTMMDINITSPIPTDMKVTWDAVAFTATRGMSMRVKGANVTIAGGGLVRIYGFGGGVQDSDQFAVPQASLVGTWSIAVTGNTMAITPPDGVTRFVQVNGTKPAVGDLRIDVGAGTDGDVIWDNLRVYQVGA